MMKGSSALVASVMAASTVALTSSSSTRGADTNKGVSSSERNGQPSSCTSSEKEKFAPRFDGLRFIETLVTAHR